MSSMALGRHEHRDVLADDLLGGVAEDPLGPLVPARDDAVEGLRDDDVVGRLDDGREPLVQQLGPPLLRDVAEDEDDADECPCSSRIGAALSSMGRSVPSLAMSTVWLARPRYEARLDDLPHRLLDGLAGLLVDDAEDVFQRLAVGLSGDPAGERLGHGVHVGDAALGVGRQDRVADGREGDLIPGHHRRGGEARLRAVFPRRFGMEGLLGCRLGVHGCEGFSRYSPRPL